VLANLPLAHARREIFTHAQRIIYLRYQQQDGGFKLAIKDYFLL
jgi:hypothetical protein